MPGEGPKFKYREAAITAVISALVPAAIGFFMKMAEPKIAPAPAAQTPPAVSSTPFLQETSSAASAAEPVAEKTRETPRPTPRVEYAARPAPTPIPTLAPEAAPPVRGTPPPRQREWRPPTARVPEVTTRPFSHEPTRNRRYVDADNALNYLFKRAKGGLTDTDGWNFTMEQRAWLNKRTGLWDQGGDEAVIKCTEQRNRELRDRFGL